MVTAAHQSQVSATSLTQTTGRNHRLGKKDKVNLHAKMRAIHPLLLLSAHLAPNLVHQYTVIALLAFYHSTSGLDVVSARPRQSPHPPPPAMSYQHKGQVTLYIDDISVLPVMLCKTMRRGICFLLQQRPAAAQVTDSSTSSSPTPPPPLAKAHRSDRFFRSV